MNFHTPPFTWLPFPSISKSVASLNDEELSQTWNASYTILRANLGCRNPARGKAVKLWKGNETALANYTYHVMKEQIRRRPKLELDDHVLFFAIIEDAPRIQSGKVELNRLAINYPTARLKTSELLPPWFGWRPLHESHKKVLYTGDLSSLIWPWKKSDG